MSPKNNGKPTTGSTAKATPKPITGQERRCAARQEAQDAAVLQKALLMSMEEANATFNLPEEAVEVAQDTMQVVETVHHPEEAVEVQQDTTAEGVHDNIGEDLDKVSTQRIRRSDRPETNMSSLNETLLHMHACMQLLGISAPSAKDHQVDQEVLRQESLNLKDQVSSEDTLTDNEAKKDTDKETEKEEKKKKVGGTALNKRKPYY